MKKYLALLVAGTLAVSAMTGCGKEESGNNSSDSASLAASEASSEDSAASGLSIDVDNLSAKSLSEFKASDYVTLGEYNGVTVEATLEEVTEDSIKEYIDNIKSTNPPMVDVTGRAVQEGDTVNIDYVGKYADTQEAFDGGTAQGADLKIGSHSYIDGFESGLVGAEIGQTVDLNLTFPEDYGSENLAGKAVVFTVTINSIKVEAEDITDEWAASLGYEGVSNLEELNKYAREKLEASAKQAYDSSIENAVIQKVQDNAGFADMPEELVNWYMKQQYEMIGYTAAMYSYYYGQQLSVADILGMYIQNEGYVGSAEDYLKEVSTDMTKQYIMFQAIADEQGIQISDEDVDNYLKNLYENAAATGYSSYEEYKAAMNVEIYREMLMAEDVVKFLVENAKVEGAKESDASTEASSDASTEASSAEESATDASSEATSTVAQ